MAKSVYIEKTNLGGIMISDAASIENWDSIPCGKLVRADIVTPRNGAHHRQFFALLRVIFDAQDYFPTQENMRKQILIGMGLYTMYLRFDGTQYPQADSLAWDKMDDSDFNSFFDRFVPFVDKHILVGVGEQVIRDKYEEILAGNSGQMGKRIPLETNDAQGVKKVA